MTRREFGAAIVITAAAPHARAEAAAPRDRIDLDGEWQFCTDPENAGLHEKWFAIAKSFERSIAVPGAWQAQGVGEPGANLRHQYQGAAWYRRTVRVPASWRNKRIALRIGGAHRYTTAFVNGIEIGRHDGFSAPFSFDVTAAIRPDADNRIVLRIENPPSSLEVSPDKLEPVLPTGMLNYLGNWGGIYGNVALEAKPQRSIESVLVRSNIAKRTLSLQVQITPARNTGNLSVRAEIPGASPVRRQIESASAALEIHLPDAPLWTPDRPNLLTASITLLDGQQILDRIEQRFGFREISTSGNVLLLNGNPLYLRGYGDDNAEVLTGFPPASRAIFRERLQRAKSFGFNAVRFHSMVPPAEYFEAADEIGILVMAELPAAYTQFFFAHREFLLRELHDVLLAYRNHPSLLSLAFGNEFNLTWLKTDADRAQLLASVAQFYKKAKELAPATLILATDGYDVRPSDMLSLLGNNAAPDRPTLRHEFGEYYCSLPDVSLIPRFTGVLKPSWLEEKQAWIHAQELDTIYPAYVRNSWKLQQLGRKYQIERVRTDARVTGYHYWLILDYPGGTAEGDAWDEGWFNYFWEPKDVTAAAGRRLNSPLLLMIDAGVDRRTLSAGDTRQIQITVSNYSDSEIRDARLTWQLLDGDVATGSGDLAAAAVPIGSVAQAGAIIITAPSVNSARKLQLAVSLAAGGSRYENSWDFWVYPKPTVRRPQRPVHSILKNPALTIAYPWIESAGPAVPPDALLLCDALDETALAHLRAGGRVWLILDKPAEKHTSISFFPRSGGALGTVVRDHPALGDFAHDGYCHHQFYTLINGATPFPIDSWSRDVQPIIGALRTTSEFLSKNKELSHGALAIEGRALAGKLFVTTLRLPEALASRCPEAAALTDSLLSYLTSDAFAPAAEIPDTVLKKLT